MAKDKKEHKSKKKEKEKQKQQLPEPLETQRHYVLCGPDMNAHVSRRVGCSCSTPADTRARTAHALPGCSHDAGVHVDVCQPVLAAGHG
jgi:hypothetical protein